MNNSNKINLFFQNYLSTISFILLGYLLYTNIPYYLNHNSINNRGFLYNNFGLFNGFHIQSTTIFILVIILYIILLIPYYIKYQNKSKALIIYEYVEKKIHNFSYKINKKEKTAILAWIVKLFYAPLMIFWVSGHIFTLINNLYYSYNNIGLLTINFLEYFNKNLFRLGFTFILFFDVIFFTLGYLIEIPFLKNQIKSVEPTLLGWAVAIICYPPFNSYLTDLGWINSSLKGFIGWYSTDFPKFNNPYIHIILNSTILLLMGIYARASVSLGFRASNLTNRGIVSKGPYKYIRHPAYICKNLSWWIGAIPMIIFFVNSNINLLNKFEKISLVLISLIGWSSIYFFRAITEERHLSQDQDYLKYKNKVKYKFIPGIY